MSEYTVIVPGRFAEDFRSAIVQEIAFDTRYMETTETRLRDASRGESTPDAVSAVRARDRRDAMVQLIRDARLAERVGLPVTRMTSRSPRVTATS